MRWIIGTIGATLPVVAVWGGYLLPYIEQESVFRQLTG
jgi:hypothetical protein